MTPQHPQPARRPQRAFTLVELMISIAIVLMLILGINEVFSIASKTIGAGQALSTIQRDNRSGHAVLYDDIKHAVTGTEAPFFIINSERVAAFRNAADRDSDRDYTEASTLVQQDAQVRSLDLDADNVEDATPISAINGRNHRVDSLRFFARDIYRRQTGNDNVFTSQLSSNEAYINYGHLRQPPDAAGMLATNSRDPGIRHNTGKQLFAENPNNFYAQQWILGRNAIVLREPEVLTNGDQVIYQVASTVGTEQKYQGRSPTAGPDNIGPLSQNSQATFTGQAGSFDPDALVQYSRFDLAGVSVANYRARVSTAILTAPFNPDWYEDVNYRFTGWLYPTKPHTSYGVARTSPVFVAGCSQFIVEYAGDFTTQLADGTVTVGAPNNEIDFIWQASGGTFVRRVRWYGFPRNVDTSDDPAGGGERIQGDGLNAVAGALNMIDVVPLRDVLAQQTMPVGPVESSPFERDLDPSLPGQGRLPAKDNYADNSSGLRPTDRYICAWGPPGTFTNYAGVPVPDPPYPRMLRVTIGIDDPNGRLTDAQMYEYVIDLP